jgi:hypothetical protein
MTVVFGEVASIYDDVRPGCPDEVRSAIVERGRGGGGHRQGQLLLRLGTVEPDPLDLRTGLVLGRKGYSRASSSATIVARAISPTARPARAATVPFGVQMPERPAVSA